VYILKSVYLTFFST